MAKTVFIETGPDRTKGLGIQDSIIISLYITTQLTIDMQAASGLFS